MRKGLFSCLVSIIFSVIATVFVVGMYEVNLHYMVRGHEPPQKIPEFPSAHTRLKFLQNHQRMAFCPERSQVSYQYPEIFYPLFFVFLR
jgi:hypothetical protein